jgi:hypothetical protein
MFNNKIPEKFNKTSNNSQKTDHSRIKSAESEKNRAKSIPKRLISRFYRLLTGLWNFLRKRNWFNRKKVSDLGQDSDKNQSHQKINSTARQTLNIDEVSNSKPPPSQGFHEEITSHGKEDFRILAHVAGDEFVGSNPQLEGGSTHNALKYMKSFLEKNRPKIDRNIIDSLDTAIEIAFSNELGRPIDKKVYEAINQCFEKQKNCLLPGGWTGSTSGHAMYYEIIPKDDKTADVRLYNLGAGCEYHGKKLFETKNKTMPYFELGQVEKNKLLDANFLRIYNELLTAKKIPGDATPTNYDANYIYDGLVRLLDPKEINVKDSSLYKTPQKSGTCSWRSLMAYMSTKLDETEYKSLVRDLQLQTLVDTCDRTYNAVNNHKSIEVDQWRLLEKAKEKVSRKIDHAKDVIDENYLIDCVSKLDKAEKQIKDMRAKILRPMPSIGSSSEAPYAEAKALVDNLKLKNIRSLQDQINDFSIEESTQSWSSIVEDIQEYDGKSSLEVIEKVHDQIQKCLNDKQFEFANTAIYNYIASLPIEDEIYIEAVDNDPEKAKQYIEKVGEIAQMYFASCMSMGDGGEIRAENSYALLKMIYIQSVLAGVVSEKHYKNMKFCLRSQPMFGFELKQPKELEEYRLLLEKMDKVQASFMNFSEEMFDNISEGNLAKGLDELFPEAFESIRKENPEILRNFKINALLFYSESNKVPQWFKGIRDSYFYFHAIHRQPVARRNAVHFPIEYKVSLYKNKSDIKCSFPNIKKRETERRLDIENTYYSINDIASFSSQIPKKALVVPLLKLPPSHVDLNRYYSNAGPVDFLESMIFNVGSDSLGSELMHIAAEEKISVLEALGVFMKNRTRLRDPGYQAHFEWLFFNSPNLKTHLNSQPFYKKVNEFLDVEYTNCLAEGQVESAVFFIKAKRLVGEIRGEKKAFKEAFENLRQIINSDDYSDHGKACAAEELLGLIGRKDSLKESDIHDLLKLSLFLKHNPIDEKWVVPMRERHAKDALIKHSHSLYSNIVENGKVNNDLINSVTGLKKSWNATEKEGEFPAIKTDDNKTSYYPLTGEIVSERTRCKLREDILAHPKFKLLFPEVTHGSPLKSGVFKFSHNNIETWVTLGKNNELIVDQKRNNEMFRYMPQETFSTNEESSALGSLYLEKNYTHWQKIRDPSTIEIIHGGDVEPSYRAKFNHKGILASVKNLKDDLTLGKPSFQFIDFEHPSFIHEWKDESGFVKKYDLPRFGLTFTRSKSNSRFYCDQLKGSFFISSKEYNPYLGFFKNYIVIENKKGEKKLLIPQQTLSAPKMQMSLYPKYEIKQSVSGSLTEDFNVFSLNEDGSLNSSSRTAMLYLAEILTAEREYESAAKILNKYKGLTRPFDKKEIEILTEISKMNQITGDHSGQGSSLRLYASYLIYRNHVKKGDETLETILKLHTEMRVYLERKKNITVDILEKNEEIEILKAILKNRYDAILFLRLQSLDPTSAKDLIIREPVDILRFSSNLDRNKLPEVTGMTFPRFIKEINKNIILDKRTIISRIDKYFPKNVPDFYEIARNGTSEQQTALRTALEFAKLHYNDGDKLELDLKNTIEFLSILLDSPKKSDFPPYPTMIKKGFFLDMEWVCEVRDKFKALASPSDSRDWHPVIPYSNEQLSDSEALPPNINESSANVDILSNNPVEFNLDQLDPILEMEQFFDQESRNLKVSQGLKDWLNKKQSPIGSDKLYIKEKDRLENDIEVYENKSKIITYSLRKKQLEPIKTSLETNRDDLNNQLHNLEVEILNDANKFPENPYEKAISQLELLGTKRKVLTLDELLVFFALGSKEDLKERNPSLSEKDINEIHRKLGNYLQLATRRQQILRSLNALAPLEKNEKDTAATQALARELSSVRSYDPNEKPAYLLFEYYSNIMLRPSQVEKLEMFLENGEQNLVMEMIMGSGKSKVLMPLLGLMRADGNKISTLIVPKPLFETVSSDTESILRDAFSQNLVSFEFNRNTNLTETYLERIINDLELVRNKRRCLIMTSKSMQCLLLKYIELSVSDSSKPEQSKEFELLNKIVNIIATDANPLIDEADTVLDVLHEVSFSTGKIRNPEKDEITLISYIYDIIYEDKNIKSIAKIDSDPDSKKEGATLTDNLYRSQIQQLVVQNLFTKLSQAEFKKREKTETVQNFFKKLTEDDKRKVEGFLCQQPGHEIQKFYNQQNDDVKNILALASEVITNYLPHTLTKNLNENYGVDKSTNEKIAIPFAAANTPSKDSQFGNHYITMLYTYQTHIKNGLPSTAVSEWLQKLQASAMSEMKNEKNIRWMDTEAGRVFDKFKGDLKISLFNYNDQDLQEFVDHINKDYEKKRSIICDHIISDIKLHEAKMSCNAHNLVEFFDQASGFTGTLWNGMSMHGKLKPSPTVGTDAKTINLLWEKSYDSVHRIDEGAVNEMMEKLPEFDLISDTGGYFKVGGNSNIANSIFKMKDKPVVYFNSQGQQVEFNGSKEILLSESNTSPEDRLTFLDQCHTTGTDIKQKPNAVGLVTVGRNMLFRDLLQSVWRLRELDKDQKVEFVINGDVESVMRQELRLSEDTKINLSHILEFSIMNQSKRQGKDNFKALKEELTCLPQSILMQALMNNKLNHEEKRDIINVLKKDWIQPVLSEPKDLFNKIPIEKDSQEAANDITENVIFRLNEIEAIDSLTNIIPFTEIKARAQKLSERFLDSIPEKIIDTSGKMDNDQSVEMEQDTEIQTETEKEVELETESRTNGFFHGMRPGGQQGELQPFDKEPLTDDIFKSNCYFPIRHYADKCDPKLAECRDCFEGVQTGVNIYLRNRERSFSNFKLIDSYRVPFYFVKVLDNDDVIIISRGDAVNTDKGLYNLTYGFCKEEREISPKLKKNIVKVKFLNGDSEYTKEERKILKAWINESGVEKMRVLFEEYLIKSTPNKRALYHTPGNQLYKLLNCPDS